MNIEKLAKEVTRTNFINESINKKKCPNEIGLKDITNNIFCERPCKTCWTNAVKDIKFKDDIEETFEAICINKGDTKYLTNDKTYLVSQSKEYEDYYDTVNDIGNIDSYRKERFRIVEGENVEDKIKLSHTPSYAEEQLEYAIEKEAETLKAKEIKKVRCIHTFGLDHKLTLKKEYSVLKEDEDWYYIEPDDGMRDGFQKHLFEEVEEQPINYEEEYKKLKEENEDLKERLDNQAESIESYIKENEKYRDYIKDSNKVFDKLTKENEKLKEEAIKDHDRIKDRDIEIKQLKFNLEQANNLGKSTNEYYYNWIETQEKNKIMESDLIGYEDTIKTLKGIIKNISEVL